MSSACTCHTDGPCFYCEIYSTLELDHKNLLKRLRRLIGSLELDQKIAESRLTEDDLSQISIGYWNAVNDKCKDFISNLKELIPDEQIQIEENDNRRHRV